MIPAKTDPSDDTLREERIAGPDPEEEQPAAASADEAPEADDEAPARPERDSGARKVMEALADDDEERGGFSLGSMLAGEMFRPGWFRRQLWFLLLIVGMLIVYVTNRYSAQQELLLIDKLKDELSEQRNKAMACSAQLMQRGRESKVAEYLRTTKDSLLTRPSQPPYRLKRNARP